MDQFYIRLNQKDNANVRVYLARVSVSPDNSARMVRRRA